ncbi:MAG TPA: hypothetical protein VHL11_18810 [Phototrophicaceae bacterium]|nr:hypothetical protein [Phototrophicaceae bacterium]
MRRWLLPFILAVLLASVFQLSRVSAGWQFIVPNTAEADQVLYATGFDAVSDEWEEADDGQRVAQTHDGMMQLTLDNPNDSVYAPLRWYFGDFDLQVEATVTGGVENNGFGVIFRQTDRKNYYYFLISADGYYQLVRVLNGTARTMSNWIPSPAIETGIMAKNQIRVVGQGDQFAFYVNNQRLAVCIPDNPEAESTYDEFAEECKAGQMLEIFTDTALTYGHPGVIAISLNDPDVEVAFDNLIVTGPAANVVN